MTHARTVIIGTRGSSLAMCQAQIVQTLLEERAPEYAYRLEPMTAHADQNPELSLIEMGGEGVFVKALETALLEERLDLAVHSLKDLPLDLSPTLRIAAVLERDEPRDALVSRSGDSLDRLPSGTRIGTSSIRRRSQLRCVRRDVEYLDIRGNVDTRLRKLEAGRYDAIVLAACGLIRLGLEERITEYLDLTHMLPEPGQGCLAVEARADDEAMLQMLQRLDHQPSRTCTEAERAFLRALGGGCRVPIAAYARCVDGALVLEGAVIAADGATNMRGTLTGSMDAPEEVGQRLATQLITQGAHELLSKVE